MNHIQTFYWYDYETFGSRPALDWPAQFAGIRTDSELNEIDKPLEIFCRFPEDQLPQPQACLITGLTPQQVNAKGVCEAEFIRQINNEFSQSGTCVAGYNSLRFDDEVTRFSLYRNFMDPYEREWKNGNSRWDLIDTVRLCAALRPESLTWPLHENGTVSFKLEELTSANGIGHSQAHDAVSDVRATIELARLIRHKQPKMFDYVLSHKDKLSVAGLLDLTRQKPVIHISSRFASERSCLGIVMPLAIHPNNKNEIIVYDLRVDPSTWLESSAEEIKLRLFSTREVLAEKGLERIPLKTVWLNRCPVLIPYKVLRDEDKQRLGIDQRLLETNYQLLKNYSGVESKLQKVFSDREYEKITDPDQMLYSGGFFGTHDKALIKQVSKTSPGKLGLQQWEFKDQRLPEMLFRYRCRNWPETLSANESERWKQFCREKIFNNMDAGPDGLSLLSRFRQEVTALLAEVEQSEPQSLILRQLISFADEKEVQFR